MTETVLYRRGTILVRRLCLAPGAALPWHRDPFERVTVVLRGGVLAIEYRDGGPSERIALAAGQVDWDEPTARAHRAVNVGEQPYEEVTVFFLDRPEAVPQPADDAPVCADTVLGRAGKPRGVGWRRLLRLLGSRGSWRQKIPGIKRRPKPPLRRQSLGMTGPRIYNLFPLLAGPVPAWEGHLGRIAAMGFDWIFVNPFHYPGFSGSLYAVKDYYRLHPLLADGGAPEMLLGDFTKAAARRGIAAMMDLVINHTAKDSVLVEQHPEWFRREADGELRSPRAIDPVDPRKFTVWGDLAEIDYGNPNTRPALIEYWIDLVKHHLKLGFKGFRCDAAYQVPVEVWQPLVAEAKAIDRDARFFAETLGCTPEQVLGLKDAGFDYLFNSAKWWDFRAPWLLEQYDLYRQVAPTVAFPESHDTERLAMELGDPEPPSSSATTGCATCSRRPSRAA